MKKHLVRATLGLIGIMGTLAIGIVNAETTITHYTGSNISYTLNGNELFTGVGTITIQSGDEFITILDRNLGATATGYGADSTMKSYGYYFQRGNNYGFATNGTILSENASAANVDATLYGPNNPYSSGVFLKNNHSPYDWATTANKNLRGGSGDTLTISKVTNPEERQGPCPVGRHVPSYSEWQTLINWIGSSNKQIFREKLYIPNAGARSFDTADPNQGGSVNLWSSSPYDSSTSHYLDLTFNLSMREYHRAFGFPVRCFYDSYQPYAQSFTLTLHANGGVVAEDTLETDDEGKVRLPNATRDADENGERVFEGWFAGEGVSEKIGNSGDVITLTGDMDVYAHWAQTITIWDPTNPLSGFTIMDRNLGAITDDISLTGSYGFHYQWGNNYGFLQSLDKTANPVYFTGTSATYDSYGPANPYSNPIFRRGNSMYDYWYTSSDHYDNLWGGGSDTTANNWGANEDNPTDRQGPCPADYHVPSAGEWGLVVKYYRDTYATGVTLNGSNGLYYFSNADASSGFMSYFQIPFAGYRGYRNASLNDQVSYGYYWSSSPYSAGSNYARYLFLSSSDVYANDYNRRAHGVSVRCFKDTYVAPISYTLTFDSQGGDEVATGVAVENTSRSRPENPSKSGYTFVDWYTSTGYETVFDFTGTLATGNLTVYAKWDKDCGDGVYFEEMDVCATKSADNLVYYRTDEKGKDVISIKDPDSDTILTILDKNQGASVAGTNYQSYGYHYQWGNNTPFEMTCTADKSCVDASSFQSIAYSEAPALYENYWPGHSYNGSKFIKGNSDYWQNNKHYVNLWGGSGDTSDTTSVDTFWGGVKNGDTRQGPCESGYHVPSMGEWNALIIYWYNTKNPGSKRPLTSLNSFSDSTFKTDFKLPLAGSRNSWDASLGSQGSYGYYWSSSPNWASSNDARNLRLYSSNVSANSSFDHAYGLSVRCFKDSYVAPISYILEFDANGGELSGADGGGKLLQKVESGKKAQEPVGISKDGAVFQGWVYSGDEAIAFNFSTPVSSNSQLKAEWSADVNNNGIADETEDHFTLEFTGGENGTLSGQTKWENVLTGLTFDEAGIIIPDVIPNSGYMFSGWNSEITGGTVITSGITLTPIYGEDKNGNGKNDENEEHFTLEFTGGENGTLSGQTKWENVLTGITFDEAGITIPEVIPNSGYMFSGWNPEITGGTIVTEGITLTPIYGEDKNGNGKNDETEEHFTLEFTGGANGTLSGQTKWENVLIGLTFDEAGIIIPDVIPNSGYVFGGWSPKTPTSGDIVSTNYSVIWKVDANNNGIADEDEPSSGGGSSGGGSSKKPSDSGKTTEGGKGNNVDNDKNTENVIQSETKGSEESSNTPMDSSANASEGQTYTQEFQEAYEFAKENGITTMPTIQNADMNGKLTRIAMAKMLSYYAINVLGMKPDETRINKFNDITEKLDAQYDSGVTLAYQLGIMGINMPNNNFRPNDVVTRAEFATALSRMLYSTPDGKPYYITHLAKLKAEGILKNDDYKMKELRGYVMIMLMRSAK